jgi:enhancer of polycomb-like protein
MRRDAQGVVRPFPGMLPAQVQHMLALQNGTHLAIPQHLKKMQPSAPGPQMRISAGGGMRPPTVSAANSQQLQSSQPLQPQSHLNVTSPVVNQSPPAPSPLPVPQHGSNGVGRPAISMPHVEVTKPDAPALPNGVANGVTTSPQPEANGDATISTPARPKSQNLNSQGHIGNPSNGYHLPLNMSAALLNSTYLPQNGQHAVGGLSVQQVQSLKSAFATLSATEMAALNGGRPLPASYLMPNMQLPPNANINLKLPNTRQTQWAMAAQMQQRPASVVNGLEGQLNGALTNGMVAVSPTLSQSVPVRSPSANGQRAGHRNGVHVNGQHSLSPHLQASPTLPNISQSQSPPRISLAPSMGLPSPSLQPVGSNQNGY